MFRSFDDSDTYAWTGHGNGSTAFTQNGLNQQITIGGSATIWDSKGNLVTEPQSGKTYGYSSENLLTSASGGVTLAYDPSLRLYQIAGAATTRFAYDGVNMIAEYDGSNALQRRFVFGPGIDQPIVQYEGSGTSDRRFMSADERGSIISLTDSSGTLLNINRYDEYGKPQLTNTGRFQYTGQKWLSEIGAYDYKARAYLPHLGIFAQTDPIGYADSPNLYAYVGGDPVNLVDPLGLDTLTVCHTTAGFVVGGSGKTIRTYCVSYNIGSASSPAKGGNPASGDPVNGGGDAGSSNRCTVARKLAGELAKSFENIEDIFNIADVAAAFTTGVSALGEIPSAGTDTALTIAAGTVTVDLGVIAFGSGAMASVLRDYANGGDPSAVLSFGFSAWAGSSASKVAETVPGLSKYAKAFDFAAAKAAGLDAEVKSQCGG